jgi:hypothetical protein
MEESMTQSTNTSVAAAGEAPVQRGIGLTGGVLVSWAAGGGILLGGFLVAAMTLAGRLSGDGILLASSGLFVVGAVLGVAHGAVLGFLGRRPTDAPRKALGLLGMASLYTVPALAVSWVVAVWIAMTVIALHVGRTSGLVIAGLAWTAGALVVVSAAIAGSRALRNAFARWPDRAAGAFLVAASFGALLVAFLAERPALWGNYFRVTEIGAVLLALFITVWVMGPTITAALWLLRRLPGLQPGLEPRGAGWGRLSSVGVALVAGIAVGLLALPFHTAPYAVPVASASGPLGAIVFSLSRAIVDEVILRLFLVSGLVWLLLQWRHRHSEANVVLAIAGAALVQIVLYTPGIMAIGFPSTFAALAYTVVAVVVPAVVFGTLYWVRGFTPALLAHATAVAATALLVA